MPADGSPTPEPRRLLDTTEYSDAILCGYGAPCCPSEDGEGLVIRFFPATRTKWVSSGWNPPKVTFSGPEGEIILSGIGEIEQVSKALEEALRVVRLAAEKGEAA